MTLPLRKEIYTCILCENNFEENSKEHIILNALGGRKKIKGFICNSCNNKTGSDWDSSLAKSLKDLSLYFCITREKGTDRLYKNFKTVGGEEIQLRGGGTLTMARPYTVDIDGNKFRIEARDKKGVKEALESLKKKYPKLDIKSCLQNVVHTETIFEKEIRFSIEGFGNEKVGRSLVKSLLGLVFDAGVDATVCEKAIEYLRNDEKDVPVCWNYYYEKDLLINRPKDKVFHYVAVQGIPETQQLLGYIEFYRTIRIVSCLSNSYTGKDFCSSYGINPVTGEELDIKININLSRDEVENDILNNNLQKNYQGGLQKALKEALIIGQINHDVKKIMDQFKKTINSEEKAYFTIDDAKKISEITINVLKNRIKSANMKKNEPYTCTD